MTKVLSYLLDQQKLSLLGIWDEFVGDPDREDSVTPTRGGVSSRSRDTPSRVSSYMASTKISCNAPVRQSRCNQPVELLG